MPTWHRLIRIISPIKLFWLGGQLFEHRPAGSHRHVSLQRPSGASIEGPSMRSEGPGTKDPYQDPVPKDPVPKDLQHRRPPPREEGSLASGYCHRDRISRPHPRRRHGGPRPRRAGDRRRRSQDRQGRTGGGPVLRTRPGTAAAEEPGGWPAPVHHVVRCGRQLRRGPLPVRGHARGRGRPGQPELRPGGGRRAGAAPEVRVPDRGQVHRPGRDGPASAAPGTCHRPGGSGGRAGLESGVPSGRTRGTGQPHSRPHRARRDVRLRGGADAAGVRRAARGGHAAARDRPGNGRAGQGGGERVPRDQDSRSSTPWPRSARRRAPT